MVVRIGTPFRASGHRPDEMVGLRGGTMGRLQLRIVLSINATFACLALGVMGSEIMTSDRLSPSLGVLAISYLIVSCYLAQGADWARVVSAGYSAIVVIACVIILVAVGGLNPITFVSLVFGLIFLSSGYLLYFSESMRAELQDRRLLRQHRQAALL